MKYYDIDEDSRLPIYAQLVARIRHAVARGELEPGAQLPTVRRMAVDLRINPNTVARAYAELEREGIIATRQGRGTFVNEHPPPPAPAERAARLDAVVAHALGEAAALGYSPEEFVAELATRVRAQRNGR